MISGKYEYDVAVSLYRNYIAHNTDRSPLMSNSILNQSKTAPNGNTYIVDGINNVSYNWKGGLRPSGGGNAHVNWIANYAKEGPYSNRNDFLFQGENIGSTVEELFFLSGNIGTARSVGDPNWLVSVAWSTTPLSNGYQHHSRWPVDKPLSFLEMTDALALEIVTQSGATVPIRDAVDRVIVESFDAGTSNVLDIVNYPDDWPIYNSISISLDSDNDGMPDNWENSHGLNILVNDSYLDNNGSGYTNIEEYLNALADGQY